MPRRTPENAQTGTRLARPLSSFTPEQRRLLLALIEAGTPTPPPAPPGETRARPTARHGPRSRAQPQPRRDGNRNEPE